MEETSWSFSLLFLLVHSFFLSFFIIFIFIFLFIILFKFYVEFLKVLVCIWVCEILNPIVLIRMIGNQFFLLFREANFWFINLFLEKTFWSFSEPLNLDSVMNFVHIRTAVWIMIWKIFFFRSKSKENNLTPSPP